MPSKVDDLSRGLNPRTVIPGALNGVDDVLKERRGGDDERKAQSRMGNVEDLLPVFVFEQDWLLVTQLGDTDIRRHTHSTDCLSIRQSSSGRDKDRLINQLTHVSIRRSSKIVLSTTPRPLRGVRRLAGPLCKPPRSIVVLV